jgi:uncharacterized protein (TIGR03435 family)
MLGKFLLRTAVGMALVASAAFGQTASTGPTFEIASFEAGGGDPVEAADPSGASIFASVQKLGLRLERRKAPVEHIVVEHLEKVPTEN